MNSTDIIIAVTAILCLVTLANAVKLLLKDYPYPLGATTGHMLMTYFACWCWLSLGPGRKVALRRPNLTYELKFMFPIAVMHALCTGLSNLALAFIYPSFRALLGSMMPMCTMIVSMLWGNEEFNRWSYYALAPIAIGMVIQVTQEQAFSLTGFLYVLFGNFVRATKVVAQARLLHGQEKLHPVELMYYVSRWSFLVFAVWTLINEGLEPLTSLAAACSAPLSNPIFFLYLYGCVVAAAYTIMAMVAVKRLNATLWTFVQQLRTPLISLLSFILFGNVVTGFQAAGFVLSSLGVYIYDTKGQVKKQKPVVVESHKEEEEAELAEILGLGDDDESQVGEN